MYQGNEGYDDSDGDTDDSNDENNWRNDYPDTEEDNDSVNENDMRRAVGNLNFRGKIIGDRRVGWTLFRLVNEGQFF